MYIWIDRKTRKLGGGGGGGCLETFQGYSVGDFIVDGSVGFSWG